MDDKTAREYVKRNNRGVLTTLKRDGRPQISLITYLFDDDGLIKISVTKDRAKTKNLRRDPRVSLACLDEQNWFSYVVVDGQASFIDDERTIPQLRHVYRTVRGAEHPNWEEFDQAMRDEGRLVLTIAPERMYGMIR